MLSSGTGSAQMSSEPDSPPETPAVAKGDITTSNSDMICCSCDEAPCIPEMMILDPADMLTDIRSDTEMVFRAWRNPGLVSSCNGVSIIVTSSKIVS